MKNQINKNEVIRILITGIGLIGLLFFLSEIGMRYQNAGSITGAAASLYLAVNGMVSAEAALFTGVLKKIWSLQKGLGITVLIIALLASGFMLLGVPNRSPSPDSTAVILGSGVYSDGKPSDVMQERIDAAIPILKQYPDIPVIVSGSQLGNAPMSEAESMKQALIEAGIDASRIYCEDQSKKTRQNLKYSAALIEQMGFSKNIILITSRFHVARACVFAKRNGLTPAPVGARTPWWALPCYWIREVYAVIEMVLFY